MTHSPKDLDNDDGQDSIVEALGKIQTGDQQAFQFLWERYYPRLIALARQKLSNAPRRATDENDVVQNAFSSFCLRARSGSFPNLRDRDSLWALLALITARTAANQRVHELRAKRGGGRLSDTFPPVDGADETQLIQVVSAAPSAEDALIFVAQFEQLMDSLEDPADRLIVLWKMEERTNPEIARCLGCSLRAVERRLSNIRKRLGEDAAIDP
jgi:RNA polymerase sigma factor (sigma-70 family)